MDSVTSKIAGVMVTWLYVMEAINKRRDVSFFIRKLLLKKKKGYRYRIAFVKY
jgi:hypothetical protein|tara:strand:- start:1156 stop:1314 length:159 start_codon:yes stop_codon:yes gene_type:complete